MTPKEELYRYSNNARVMVFITSMIFFAGMLLLVTGEYADIATDLALIGGIGLILSYIVLKLYKRKIKGEYDE